MKNTRKDFQDFTHDSSLDVAPSSILAKIHQQIEKESPTLAQVAMKLGVLHLISSVITLMTCPQFGFRLFFKGDGLMDLFMRISPTFCHTFCGAFYLAWTFLLVRVFFKPEEWFVLLRTRTLSIALLALGSLGAFSMISPEVTLQAGVLWLFGAAVGAELMTFRKGFWRSLKV